MDYMALSTAEWQQEYDKVSAEYESWKAKGLKLNMARGKPSKQQLDMVSGLLTALTSAEECVDSGVDARNYGELKGLESARKLFADILGSRPLRSSPAAIRASSSCTTRSPRPTPTACCTAKSRGARKRASNGSAPRRAMTATSR